MAIRALTKMLNSLPDIFTSEPGFTEVFDELGLNAQTVWTHPAIRVWRSLPDRENGVIDATLRNGRAMRFHVKRYVAGKGPAIDDELRGHRLLESEQIPTAKLAASGRMADGRSFVIFEDLTDYQPADKWIEAGGRFADWRKTLADTAAQLHARGLHHRDLYLCHFMINPAAEVPVRVIDVARVKKLPRFFAQRWIVKDLAQFWYSTLSLPISEEERCAWLVRYAQQRGISNIDSLKKSIQRKSDWIARHDRKLREKQPTRNVSIPDSKP